MKLMAQFTFLLTCLFITLKLAKIITWSWFLVLSPIWIAALLIYIIMSIAIIIRNNN